MRGSPPAIITVTIITIKAITVAVITVAIVVEVEIGAKSGSKVESEYSVEPVEGTRGGPEVVLVTVMAALLHN